MDGLRRVVVALLLLGWLGGCESTEGSPAPDGDSREAGADMVSDAVPTPDTPEAAEDLPPDGDAEDPGPSEVEPPDGDAEDPGPSEVEPPADGTETPDAEGGPDSGPPPPLTGSGFTVLTDFLGSTEESGTTATAVSGDGLSVVGVAWSPTIDNYEAFLWTSATGMVGLGLLPDHNVDSNAAGISPDGRLVVGVSRTRAQVGADIEYAPFRWTEEGGMEALAVGPSTTEPGHQWLNAATDVTDAGVVVGHARWIPTRWLADGTRQPLTDKVGFGNAVSADGSVAVGEVVVGFGPSGVGIVRAFRWTEAEGLALLKDAAGKELDGAALDVSGDGAVVVGQCTPSAAAGPQACRWTAETGWVGLGRLPGHALSLAQAVSGDGLVVAGRSCTADNGGNPCWGFLWTPAGGLVELSELLKAGGATLGSHHVGRVHGASSDGRVLVGEAHIGKGKYPEWFALQIVLPE